MTEERVSIHVISSWEVANGKSLQDAITLTPSTAAKRNEDGSLTDMVELESCVHLTQPVEENGNQDTALQPCIMSLKLEAAVSPSVITNVVIISEARVIEVYGAYNEYLSTKQADLLDEVEDTAVYSAEIALSQLTQECTLKFAKFSRPSDMWLYGVKVFWNTKEEFRQSRSQSSGLNFETVERRLKESQTQLSGRAESCKQFLKMYSTINEQKQTLPDALSLLSLLPGLRRQSLNPGNSHLKTTTYGFAASTSTASSNAAQEREQAISESGSSLCAKCSHNFENALDQRLTLMENRIMKALDDKIATLQQHQDNQFQNFYHLLSESRAPFRFNPREPSSLGYLKSEKDTKIEEAIKKLLDQKDRNSAGDSVKSITEDPSEHIMRNAFMTLRLNEMFSGTPHQPSFDKNAQSLIQNGS